jgi:hypothetical protein
MWNRTQVNCDDESAQFTITWPKDRPTGLAMIAGFVSAIPGVGMALHSMGEN